MIWIFKGAAEGWEDVFDPGGYTVGGFGMLEQECTVGRAVGEEEMQESDIADGHLRQDTLERVGGAVVRDEDPCGVIQEMMEVEQVHWVIL